MSAIKKPKNIFQNPILHQSLFYEQVVKLSKVGGIMIGTGWLANKNKKQHLGHIKSAIELAQIQDQMAKLQKKSQKNNRELNMFKLAQLKRKMQKFQNDDDLDYHYQGLNLNLIEDLIVQKISDYFHTQYLRKAILQQKILTIQSKKSQNTTKIDLSKYTIQIEYKNNPLNNPLFQYFGWPENETVRLLLYGDNLRSYCLYATTKKNIQKILNYIHIQCLSDRNMKFFDQLNLHFTQKIFTIFGQRLRFYQHNIREKRMTEHETTRNIKNNKSQENQIEISPPQNIRKQVSQNQVYSPSSRPKTFSSSMFRLKNRRATVYYDQLGQSFDLSKTPDEPIKQFHLGIKQQAFSDNSRNSNIKQNMSQLNLDQRDQQFQQQQISNHSHEYKTKISSPIQRHPKLSDNISSQIDLKGGQEILINYKPLTIRLGFNSIETYIPSQKQQFTLIIKQLVQPQYQTSLIKTNICCRYNIHFKKISQYIYKPQNQIQQILISQQSTNFIFILKTQTQQISNYLQIPVKINYQINVSQFFYSQSLPMKICIFISPDKLINWPIIKTIDFIKQYLFQKNQDYYFKKDYINNQVRNYEIDQQWNNKLIKKIINSNDRITFQKGLYKIIPKSILIKIIKKLAQQNKQPQTKFQFTQHALNKMQFQIFQNPLSDLKIYIKPSKIIQKVLNIIPNQIFKKRLSQLQIYFSYKYGNIRDLGFLYAKQIIRKISSILILCRNQQQVQKLLQLYFEVQYQINQLFQEISKYFDK